MQAIRAALIQHACGESPAENLNKTEALIGEAAAAGARLICLPELHATRYFPQTQSEQAFDLAEPIPGPQTERLGALARKTGAVVVASLFERRAPGLYHNTAVVLERDGTIAGLYRKMHIPDDPGFHEKFYFTPGDLGFRPIRTSLGLLGVLVCWDQWFPEAARLMALGGARLLIYPTAIGWLPEEPPDEQRRQRESWITVQRGHAIANNLPVLCINRTGWEPAGRPADASNQKSNASAGRSVTDCERTGIQFWGSSFAADCRGEILAQAEVHDETMLIVSLDMEQAERVRRQWPFFRDRRPDAYEGLLERFLGNERIDRGAS
ncbi:MAG: carbon-nitrogen hydrolase [Candidatus Sumerlaeia bacterium]